MTTYANTNSIAAHLDGVVAEVRRHGTLIGARARADLANHRETGASRIQVTADSPDTLVSLVDRAAVSIEYGHGPEQINGRHVGASRGLYILSREL